MFALILAIQTSSHSCLGENENLNFSKSGVFEFENCIFLWTNAGQFEKGGSFYICDLNVSLIISNCFFYKCASLEYGGVIFYTTSINQGTILLSRSCIVDCKSKNGMISYCYNVISYNMYDLTVSNISTNDSKSSNYFVLIKNIQMKHHNHSSCHYYNDGVLHSEQCTNLHISFSLISKNKLEYGEILDIFTNKNDTEVFFTSYMNNTILSESSQIHQGSEELIIENCIFSMNNEFLLFALDIKLKNCLINHVESKIIGSGLCTKTNCTISKHHYNPYPFDYYYSYMCLSDRIPPTQEPSPSASLFPATPIQTMQLTIESTLELTKARTNLPTQTAPSPSSSLAPSINDSSKTVLVITTKHILYASIFAFVVLISFLFCSRKKSDDRFLNFSDEEL